MCLVFPTTRTDTIATEFVCVFFQTTNTNTSRLRQNYTLRLMSVSGGAQLATASDIEATIIVVASGHPRGLFQFTGPPTVSVTRQQNQVSTIYCHWLAV